MVDEAKRDVEGELWGESVGNIYLIIKKLSFY